jgi:hypothetical protein
MKIKIKVKEDRLPQIISKGDWIDLANETKVELNGLKKNIVTIIMLIGMIGMMMTPVVNGILVN